MKVAFNIFPLQSAHKNRGVGSYTKNLLDKLTKRQDLQIIQFTDIREVKEADLVHYPWFDLFFRTLPIRKKFKTVVTVHDVIPLVFPDQYPLGVRGRINFYLQKQALKGSRAILTDSESSKQDIIKYLKIAPEKITVVALSADESFTILTDGQKLHVKRKFNLTDNFLLYVGDANYFKNLPFLMEGFYRLKKQSQFKDLKLVLVGGMFLKKLDDINHPELNSLKQTFSLMEKYDLAKEVIRPGQISTEDLVGFYNLATIYVQPSLYEGFGLPVLEALNCSCPVVSSNAGSLKEVGGEAVLFFDPKNLDQFTDLLSQLLQDGSLRNKLAKLGLAQATKFSWEKTSEETVKVYKRILKTSFER